MLTVSQGELREKFNFCMKINTKVFYIVMPSFFLAIASILKVPKITSLQYHSKIARKGRDKLDFLHADKHLIFLPVETIYFDGHCQSCPKYPK